MHFMNFMVVSWYLCGTECMPDNCLATFVRFLFLPCDRDATYRISSGVYVAHSCATATALSHVFFLLTPYNDTAHTVDECSADRTNKLVFIRWLEWWDVSHFWTTLYIFFSFAQICFRFVLNIFVIWFVLFVQSCLYHQTKIVHFKKKN